MTVRDVLVFKRGPDGGCQLRELPAALPAGEQIDIALPRPCEAQPEAHSSAHSRRNPPGGRRGIAGRRSGGMILSCLLLEDKDVVIAD
jgi:hypothetical protein